MNRLFIASIVLLSLSAGRIIAQNPGNEEVNVSSDYNPVLADAVKETFTPSIPDEKSPPVKQDYHLPLTFYQIPYQPLKVKPIRLPDEKPEQLDHAYIKAGFGTQLTPLAEAYIASDRAEQYNYSFYGRYISQNGSLENQKYSDIRVGGNGTLFFDDKYALPLEAYYSGHTFHYYGYNDSDTSFEADDVKQKFNNYGFGIGLFNTGENEFDLDFGGSAGLKGIADINGYTEYHPYLNAFGEKELQNEHIAGVSISYDYYGYNGVGSEFNYITGIKPYYKIIRDEWSVNAGLGAKVDKDSRSYILPDADFSYDLVGDKLVFVAGWHGDLQINNFENLVQNNPFITDTLEFINSEIQEKSIGLRGSTNGNFSFVVKGYQKNINDMPFYITDSLDTKRFDVVYDNASIWGGLVELAYFNSDIFNFTGSVNVYRFASLDILDAPYQQPTLEWTLGGSYRLNSKMMFTADIFGIGKSTALLPDGTESELRGTTDLNIAATYKYSKYFNIFLNLNNMANFKYERYYNYPGFGAQVIGGISFAF